MSEEFTFRGLIPFVVFSHRTITTIFGDVYSLLGQNGADALLYNIGHKTGKIYVEEQRNTTGSQKLDLLDKCMREDFEARWGKFEYNLDFNTLEGEVRLYDSYLAKSWIEITQKKQEYPVCAFLSGYIAGIIEATFGEKVVVEEKACIALGNEYCLFKVRKDILGD